MKGKMVFIVCMLLVLVISAGCGAGAQEPTETPVPTTHPGKTVMNNKCGTCHGLDQVTSYRDDVEGWELTVDRMITLGADLSDAQREDLIDYLAMEYPEE